MKTKEQQGFRRLGRRAFGLQVLMLVLVMLTGASPTWAWGYSSTNSDSGGGTYKFAAEKYEYDGRYCYNARDFRTQKTFNFINNQFSWEFDFRVANLAPSLYIENLSFEGEVDIVDGEGVSHRLGTWTKTRSNSSSPVGKITDSTYGSFAISKVDDGHTMKVVYTPSDKAFERKVSQIILKHHFIYGNNKWESGWMQYTKDLGLSAVINAENPMPKLAFEFNDECHIVGKAADVMDKLDDERYSQGYWINWYNGASTDCSSQNFNKTVNNITIKRKSGGKMDMTLVLGFSEPSVMSLTEPCYIVYFGRVWIEDTGISWYIPQPSNTEVVSPYTYPTEVKVEFDKWNKRNTISWNRQKTVKGYNGSKEVDVKCRQDGTWYVLRYEKGKEAKEYEIITTLSGNTETLQVVDSGDNLEYGKDYVYRILFLPDLLKSKYQDKLANIPSQSSQLWYDVASSTALEMPIKLSQDRTYADAVRLVWEYCVQPSGQNWTIEYSPAGENSWRVLDNSLTVDPDKSQASFDATGTVCDLVDYRVKTTYADKDFYSNVCTGNLPAGSYISEVKASTGTEESSVIVKWKVVRADVTNDTYYRVLRRTIGTEEWTELTSDIHGTASEYTYTDNRVMAGSYYEYSVVAYGAKCDEQLIQTDEVITPGFSQARGTITGHISFGTGTAVKGARVNLVKTSADQGDDQVQYLSRYIEGSGKGLQWKADREAYAKLFSGGQAVTTQLWTRPISDGAAQMSLLSLPGAIELGVKRIGDTSGYELQLPDDNWIFISSAADWKDFANAVNSGRTGLNAIMTADVDVSAAQMMVGNSSEHAYSGTFDGNGHTLTVSYSTNEQVTAPFRYTAGATIKNLRTAGTLTSKAKNVAGLVGFCLSGTNVITNCRVSATIDSSIDGDATNGGFVAYTAGGSTLNISDCLFDGKFTGSNCYANGGLVGWNDGNTTIKNCLYNGSSSTKTNGNRTFSRSRDYSKVTLTDCYYTNAMDDGDPKQGTSTEGMDNSTLLAKLGTNWQIANSQLLVKMVSVVSPSLPRKAYTVTTVDKHSGTGSDSTAVYQLYAVDLSTTTPNVTEFPALTFSGKDFTHVAAVYDGSKKWKFYVGTDSLRADSLIAGGSQWIPRESVMSVGGSGPYSGTTYKGHVDDIRLWARALKTAEVESNYTRILGGTEDGLRLYWPLDEGMGVKDYAFDIARQDGMYQLNHPEVGVNATPSSDVPRLLSLYGVTDDEGDYIIIGIPFQQGGTNYKIVPKMGSHEFSPNTRTMFVSPTSLTANNIDFEDVSSFPMEGYVYYAGTNIPAEGIQFYVDGQLLTTDGEVQQSDAQGRYRISVPIGEHFVEAKLANHKMVNQGRFPIKGKRNFNAPVTYNFSDSTLVNFVGRVSGGERNDTLAVGFGASKNNIGTATITLKLNNESLSFNRVEGKPQTSATQIRTWESDTVSINSKAWTGTGSDESYIYIQTDPATGEFSAKLPPLKYITKKIELVKKDENPNIEFTMLPEVDLSNVLKEQADSLWQLNELGDSVCKKYTYHTKLVQTYFATPQVDISQPKSGKGVFGIQEYKGEDELGKFTVSDLWTRQDDGTVSYKYDFPIYKMGDEYRTELFGYEVYTNYDSGEAVADTIPLSGQVITVANEMSSDQTIVAVLPPGETEYQLGQVYDLKKNQLVLDSLGRYAFKWNAGAPNVVSPYTRHLGITMVRSGRTYVPNGIDAIVVGTLPVGNNFVTNGPDQVLMVLRDPPGAKSKTVWKTGSTKTKVSTSTSGGYGSEKIMYEANFGMRVRFMSGFGLYYETTDLDNTSDIGGGIHYTWNKNSSTEKTWTLTATEQVSTGATKDYCGSNGDVFIGYSTNLLLGKCRKVGFFRDNETAPFVLKDDVATSLGDSVTTKFMYSTYELREVMIPKWRETRNSYITQHFATEAEARAFVNNTNDVLYATWLSKDKANYGTEGTYIQVTPAAWESLTDFVAEDKVAWCNNQIENWQKVLYNNEYDKVTAIENRDKYWQRNISFDGGSGYSYTARNDTTKVVKHNYSHNLGGIVKGGFSTKNTAASIQFKTKMSVDTENGWAYSTTESDYDENTKDYAEFDYTFDDGNKGTDFSVDIYKSPTGWSDIFSIFGGQSYNPYQKEEKTQYYEPGQHILSNGTEQMENPDIQISTDGGIAVKSAVLTDIPAGQTGQFTLHLSNISTTTQGFDFTYNLSVAEGTNQHGLEILMDGVPANGRGIFIPAGETVKKVITVRQTDQSVLDYENIELWFSSAYQAIKIHDIAKLSVHFKPSSSPVELAITEPVVNCKTDSARLEMKVKGFNRQFKNLKNVGVQYRFQGNTQWTALHTWVTNKADSLNANYNLLPATGDLPLELKMISDQSYPEGNYEFRAFTTTPYGNEQVQVYSDVINVVKDITRPINIFTPTPANGILGYGDQLSIEFNEDIVPGYVGADNVVVTAKLNQEEVHHDVSLTLHPFGDQPMTVNPVFMNGDFSVEFWLKWDDSGTILHQGPSTDNFALGINSEGRAIVTIAQKEFVSTAAPLPKGEWTFFALNYKQATMTFNVMASYGTTDVMLFTDQKVPNENVQAVNYTSDNCLYLGEIEGNIHSLALYNIWRNVNEASSEKYVKKDNYVYGLANYWPMDEGHGFRAADSRHTHDFITPNRWTLENENYSLRITDRKGAEADISQIGTSRGESYAIELWYSKSMDEDEVVFETATPTVEGDQLKTKLKLHYNDSRDLVLDYGTNSQMVASHEYFDFTSWHHYALNVVRGQAASFYLDGQRTAVIPEADMVPIEGSRLIVGNKATWAMADEIRIWKAALSESRLLQNMYNTIDTASIYSHGLVAYYPFEKRHEENNHVSKVATLDNMAPKATAKEMICHDFNETDLVKAAPPLKNAPDEQPLIVTPVVSERKVVINLTGTDLTPRKLEGTTLNITVDKIHDLHGNESQPIKWTAYVQQNTLTWMKDSVNIIKKYGDDYTFDVDIENKSGSTEYYTLYNMPQWLSLVDSERTDDVSPLKTKTLRFEVNPLVPVGNYDVAIGLLGNNGILEPLRIVMKVRGEKPQWAVDPTKYDHNMSIIGQVYISGILMENPESMVAAFIGNECRGVASPEKVRGAAYVTMNVYGTDNKRYDMGKEVSFRIWDASKGVAYTDANIAVTVKTAAMKDSTVTTVIFGQDKILGDFDTPAIWTKSENMEQLIPIHQNWNWIAFGVEPQSTYLDHVFGAYAEWSMLLKSRDNWNDYNGAQWGGGTLKSAKANEMYKLKIDRLPTTKQDEPNSLLAVSGRQLKEDKERAVTLAKGWNWIAYTPLTTMTVDEALAAANPQKGDIVKSQTGVAIYGEYGWEGSLKALESGRGYLYYSNANDTTSFLYPTETAASAARAKTRMAAPRRAPEDLRIFNPVPLGLYPSNMTMAIQLRDGDAVVDTAEVAAFISDECRGATRASENGLYYLVVSGDGAGQSMTLRTCLDGEIIDIDNTQMYVSDANIGTSWAPYVIDLSKMRTGISTIAADDADDDSDWWTLQGFKIGRKPTQPGVYIHHGKKVTIKRVK